MTDERMALIELIEKGADADLIRDMLAFAAERLMNLEVEALTGHEVTPEKQLGVEAIGSFWLVMVIVPLLVVLGVFILFRLRRSQSMYWTVTVGMLLIAGTVLLLGRIEYIGSMAALTWASFQIRRAELPGKMAEREAVRSARAEAAAAATAEEDDDEDEYEYDEDDDAEEGEYDEDDYAEEGEYDEDDYAEDVEDVEDDYVDEEGDEGDEPEPVTDAAADDESDDVVDYDEDILKELEAEIDESEGRADDDGKPGSR